MPLSSLHTIELQLVMRQLDFQSILAFASCDRSTHAASRSPFAWSALSLIRLPFDKPAIEANLLRMRCLPSPIPLELYWPTRISRSVDSVAEFLSTVRDMADVHVVSVDVSSVMLRPPDIQSLVRWTINAGAVRSIRSLKLLAYHLFSSAVSDLERDVSSLHTLHLIDWHMTSAVLSILLPAVPQLTELRMDDRRGGVDAKCRGLIAACPMLRRLELGRWEAAHVAHLLTLPAWSQHRTLQDLRLADCELMISAGKAQSILRAIPSLESLELTRCGWIGSLIDGVLRECSAPMTSEADASAKPIRTEFLLRLSPVPSDITNVVQVLEQLHSRRVHASDAIADAAVVPLSILVSLPPFAHFQPVNSDDPKMEWAAILARCRALAAQSDPSGGRRSLSIHTIDTPDSES